MAEAPPSLNPNRYVSYYPKRKHWRNAQEIHPGYWLVEECSGPRSTVISLAVVRYQPSIYAGRSEWAYVGTVGRTSDSYVTMEVNYLDKRDWKISAVVEHYSWLVSELVRLVKEFG